MVSGPEVAASLAQWMRNHEGRRMAQVNQTAERTKEELMNDDTLGLQGHHMRHRVVRQFSTGRDKVNESLLKGKEESQETIPIVKMIQFLLHPPLCAKAYI